LKRSLLRLGFASRRHMSLGGIAAAGLRLTIPRGLARNLLGRLLSYRLLLGKRLTLLQRWDRGLRLSLSLLSVLVLRLGWASGLLRLLLKRAELELRGRLDRLLGLGGFAIRRRHIILRRGGTSVVS